VSSSSAKHRQYLDQRRHEALERVYMVGAEQLGDGGLVLELRSRWIMPRSSLHGISFARCAEPERERERQCPLVCLDCSIALA